MVKKKEEKLPPKVRKRSNGYSYRYSVPIIGPDCKPDRKQKETHQYPTAQEAYNAGILIEAELVKGTYVDEDNILFTDWADVGLKLHAELKDNKQKGIRTHLSRLTRAKKYFAGKKLKDITRTDYEKFLLHLRDDVKRSKSTVKNTHGTMRIVFRQAERRGLIAKDPTHEAELPVYRDTLDSVEEDPLPRYLEREQLLVVLRTARVRAEQSEDTATAFNRWQLYRAVYILAYTGLRLGELLSLERRKWNRNEGAIHVTATLDSYGGAEGSSLDTPKNKPSRRIVDVSDSVSDMIDAQIKEIAELRLRAGQVFYTDASFIFVRYPKHAGRPLSLRVFGLAFAQLMEQCEIKGITPHCLRHTFTSLSAEAGVPLEDVQKQLGHASDVMTKRVYLHITKPRRKANVAKLDALLRDNNG